MWTPLPPERSGIADYSYELLTWLAGTLEIKVPIKDGDRAELPEGVSGFETPVTDGAETVNVYQMGNHMDSHSWIYDRALVDPGVLVLHDTSLFDFHAELLRGPGTEAFAREVEYAHGMIRSKLDDPARIDGWPAIDVDGILAFDRSTLTLERRLVEASRAVVVHDPQSQRWLHARYPGKPVYRVPHGAPVRDDSGREEIRGSYDWGEDKVVFGVFGGFGQIKRILVTVLCFARIRRRWPQARLVIVGHVDNSEVLDQVRDAVAELGIDDSVELRLAAPKSEFEDLLTACDAVINLRWPTAGETSGVMMRAFGSGRIVITSDLPQHRHFDSSFCLRVPTDPAGETEELLRIMEWVLACPEEARLAGDRAREFVGEHASWPVAAAAYRNVITRIAEDGALGTARPTMVRQRAARGVNIHADFRASTGISEAARRHSVALSRAGVEMTYTEFSSRWPHRSVSVPDELAELRRGKDCAIDLWMLNVNEFDLVPHECFDRYAIALWAWEMPEIPEEARVHLSRLDELWVVSSFVADAFRTATDIPISVIPNVIPSLERGSADRTRFGLPQEALVVLFSFSASSSDARKNPWGAIDAFERAFSPAERGRTTQLVIKANDLDQYPAMARRLAERVAAVNGTLVEDDLTRESMNALLDTCDIYLSLHRSEGFGFGMAEAMSLGKPVIATGYGGNTDFMSPGSAAIVGYTPRKITNDDHRFDRGFSQWYRPGKIWAEPNLDQAARWLRLLATDKGLRQSMGRRAAIAVESSCSATVVGRRMARRLAEIDSAKLERAHT